VYSELGRFPDEEEAPLDPKAEPNKFFFTVESVGSIKPEEIMLSAISVLQGKLGAVQLHLEQESRSYATY
jgi:DNA-directed RNA polymerase II subunit RPB3